ncbi:hypothetical protein HPP92_023530 [Vanilla planifolia]|uniref:Uncharacterized protein n=1 Tax=Vanilla planifolia TaxID=51239 RepID=A0A835PTB5_VANPL|nr:hypothetical protein HPP92_023530 [Vanilla planifolia]
MLAKTFKYTYSTENCIFSIHQRSCDINALYVGEGGGMVKLWDERSGKISGSWNLHKDRINTVDFNPENLNLMATSSTDGTACIWDLRSIKKYQSKQLKMVQHKRAVHSAYFSPSGVYLATTSFDDRIGILSVSDPTDLSMVRHNNQAGRWLSSFRGYLGMDDSLPVPWKHGKDCGYHLDLKQNHYSSRKPRDNLHPLPLCSSSFPNWNTCLFHSWRNVTFEVYEQIASNKWRCRAATNTTSHSLADHLTTEDQSAICSRAASDARRAGRRRPGPAPVVGGEGRCRTLISRIRPPRRYEGEFRYDPMSYARNFDEGGEDGSADEERFRFRDFASRLPSTPPMPAIIEDINYPIQQQNPKNNPNTQKEIYGTIKGRI